MHTTLPLSASSSQQPFTTESHSQLSIAFGFKYLLNLPQYMPTDIALHTHWVHSSSWLLTTNTTENIAETPFPESKFGSLKLQTSIINIENTRSQHVPRNDL